MTHQLLRTLPGVVRDLGVRRVKYSVFCRLRDALHGVHELVGGAMHLAQSIFATASFCGAMLG